jgi:hypothetical protein
MVGLGKGSLHSTAKSIGDTFGAKQTTCGLAMYLFTDLYSAATYFKGFDLCLF